MLQNLYLQKFITKIYYFLISFIEIQLAVTLVSLPILVYWGLSISFMTFIGNLIFTPFLAMFLGLSSVIFFSELLNINNNFLIYLLEKSTIFWQNILFLGNKKWLVAFGQTNILILLLIPIFTFLIIKNKKFTQIKKIIFLLILLIFFTSFLKLKTRYFAPDKIVINNKILVLKNNNNFLEITDNGMFSKKESIEKFIEYNLRQEIIKNFGTINIDKLTITNPGIRSFKGILACIKFFNLKEIKMPYFNKKLSKYGWKLFFDIKRECEKSNIKITR